MRRAEQWGERRRDERLRSKETGEKKREVEKRERGTFHFGEQFKLLMSLNMTRAHIISWLPNGFIRFCIVLKAFICICGYE